MSNRFAIEALDKVDSQARFMEQYMADRFPSRGDALLAAFNAATRDERLAFLYAAVNVGTALVAHEEQQRDAPELQSASDK